MTEIKMDNYSLLITVEGDWVCDPMKIGTEMFADNVDDFAEKTYNLFKIALHRVWKDMESNIYMETYPSPLITIEWEINGRSQNPEDLYKAYFKIRKHNWLESVCEFHRQTAA